MELISKLSYRITRHSSSIKNKLYSVNEYKLKLYLLIYTREYVKEN